MNLNRMMDGASDRSVLGRLVTLLVIVFSVLVILPQGSPLWIGYVNSDSMEPTIGVDDGFLVEGVGGVEEGDIVVFWSPQRGTYVTHRIVGETETGYVTQGDNNPSTDQKSGYSYVQDEEIAGEVVTVGGRVLIIPAMGVFFQYVRDNLFLVLGGIAVVLFVLDSSEESRNVRSNLTERDVVLPIFLAALVAGTGFVVAGAQTQQYEFVAKDPGSAGPNELAVGEPLNSTFVVTKKYPNVSRTVVSTEGATVVNRSRNASAVTVTARVPPPSDTGVHTVEMSVYRYPLSLPPSVVRGLHSVHPFVAAVVTVSSSMLPLFLLYVLFFDGRKPIRSSRSRTVQKLQKRW